MSHKKDIVFIPDGDIDSLDYFSGIPHFFYNSLISIEDVNNIKLHTIIFSECFELEEIVKLINNSIDKKIFQKSNKWLNSDFIKNVKKAKDDYEIINAIKAYWSKCEDEIYYRWPKGVSFKSPTLLLSPFYPFIGEKTNLNFYLDCSNVKFFFDKKFGTLKEYNVSEILIEFFKQTEQRLLEKAENIFCFSEKAKIEINQLYNIPLNRLRVVGAGANLYQYPEPKSIIVDKEKLNILFIGKDFYRKGGNTVLKIAESLPINKFSFTIITNYQPISNYKNVKFLQPLPKEEIICFYEEADVFLFPTNFEPFGIVILEAMSYSLPIIASNIGSIPELLGKSSSLFCHNPNDVSKYIDSLIMLYNNYEHRKSQSNINYNRAIKLYKWETVSQKIIYKLLSN